MARYELTEDRLAALRGGLGDGGRPDAATRRALNAATTTDVDQLAINRDAVVALGPEVEGKLDSLSVTDQKQSGRCWMFAAFNVFRHRVAKELGVENFEFSEAYLQFYDLLGKAEVFLDSIAKFEPPYDEREAALLLGYPDGDGGWWEFFTSLVKRFGVVPKYAMPETQSSSQTRAMGRALGTVLRRGALAIDAGNATKEDVLRDVYRVLAVHLGVPPEEFTWQYRDKDGEFHREGTITPREFAERFLPDLDEYVQLGNDPRPDRPFGTRYLTEGQQNVPGGAEFTWVNASAEELKATARRSLEAEEPVWFSNDVKRQLQQKLGLWDTKLLDTDLFYGIDSELSKGDQMATRESVLTHAMVFTGYDEGVEGVTPPRWRVENSWGSKKFSSEGGEGYGVASDRWFDDNVFTIVVHRRFVDEKLLAAFDAEPVVLPPWDAMS
ncbi:C1 family peptidase [Corynebacterium otitidis]|uniref:Aminopeptidase n=1 Tax=Corynebacterium otitidis ATCC 51513 TaxID=883169 RepID=K0Z354_9CORY|nr:C1 family peptidase [Corynebacterium otitidis]EJZ81785.1 hypothetical protein HMPREF9719_01302 [Corynebacterium otitidis ATCC 51513]